jgi:hypothetical protein
LSNCRLNRLHGENVELSTHEFGVFRHGRTVTDDF